MDYNTLTLEEKIEIMARYSRVFHDFYLGLDSEQIMRRHNLTEGKYMQLVDFFLRVSNRTLSLRERVGHRERHR